jgi:proteic killer suppression protein
MIRSFKCRETEKIWQGHVSRKFPGDIQNRALRKLRQLNASTTLDDLKNPPGNCLEALKHDRKGQMSIRINRQWRSVLFGTTAKRRMSKSSIIINEERIEHDHTA